MKLKIEIKNKTVLISLFEKNKTLDKLVFKEDHDLSDILLLNVDKLLKRNKIMPADIQNAAFISDLKDSFTAHRIVESAIDTFGWYIRESKKS